MGDRLRPTLAATMSDTAATPEIVRTGSHQMGQFLGGEYDTLVSFGDDLWVCGRGVPPLRWNGTRFGPAEIAPHEVAPVHREQFRKLSAGGGE